MPTDHVDEFERRAEAAYQRQKKFSVFKPEDTGKIAWETAKIVTLAIRANHALHTAFRVSIDDLITGTVIEGTLVEILELEATIARAFDGLQRLVHAAASFEQNSETIVLPDDQEDDQLAPPSTWPRYNRG